MNRKFFALMTALVVIAGLFTPLAPQAVAPQPVQAATATIDGIVDAGYGAPIASDPAGDGNSNANLDLLNLYVTDDADYYYFAFTINDDIVSTNWGKYVIYIDTTNDTHGATSDAWGRNVVVTDTHKPEFGLYAWVDSGSFGPSSTQLVGWDGSSWDWGNVKQAAGAALATAGGQSVIEYQVAKADLGDPDTLWVEVWDTGNGGSDNAQDTINAPADDWNASDWSTQSVLSCSTQYGAPVVDGTVDSVYGSPIASDPAGDGNSNANLDLLNLYVTDDADYYYFAFTINDDIVSTNWGKYVIYIDTTNDTHGATSDAWGRNVVVTDTHKPEFGLYAWVDSGSFGPSSTQLVGWDGSSWDWGNVKQAAGAALATAGGQSVIEYQVAKADLGDPDTLWVEVWDTGNGGSDNAQDTINAPADDWNASDWSTQSVLSCSTQYGAPVVDGTVDSVYGAPIASDPAGDGNSNANLDLLNLYVTDDADYYYFAFTINDDIVSTNWGKYVIYIDTTNDTHGATSDAWGRNVVVTDTHKPEFGLYAWVDSGSFGPSSTQLVGWDGSSWDWGNVKQAAGAALATAGGQSVIEYQVAKADLGDPDTLWVEVWDTGNGGSDNAQDTINAPADDWNASDWSTQSVLSCSTEYGAQRYRVGERHASHDNNIWWDDLGHNSRELLYRTPGGAVETATSVKLRLRAASGDLTAAKVRVWNDRTDTQTLLDMAIVADDGTYEWWEATVPASADPTIYWYRFIAIDGTATAYYEDDAGHTGGWGQTFAESPDNSWQITVYDPDYETPDWAKNAVIYQIFPDRFRDGDEDNDPPPGSFHYDLPDGSIYRSTVYTDTDWNTPICDPRDAGGDCPGKWGENFYGGDLQGITDELDNLQDLGVTALYLNPVFESPSNHKYDTTDFSIIDDAFGDLSTFITLTIEAHNRGMKVILDGVFNHTSSDSIYFDRYGRYTEVGACESQSSPYRDWYYFTDVEAGTGECVGSDGAANAATYESWFGYDSLPKLDASNAEVRALIWDDPDGIARAWLQYADGWRLDVAGDVDPGVTGDPTNDYWEGFRAAVRDANPGAYIIGEEWGNSTPWLLGDEWDASMNYQFGSALMSFWRDEPFTDNDHNSSSSAGSLNPISPSQLDERLHYLEERYPPEAFYAMMNLLDSHDTNRALFLMDHNADQNDRSLYENPAYDWSDAITRLKGVALLQFTLPGAPTIYYGDEIGLVAPPTYSGGRWEDDPYNRIPYPWLDETGTPFYTHLQTQGGQDTVRDYYELLTGARNSHAALRTGSFDTLLMDDDAKVYAYGRKMEDNSDAAIVIANRDTTPQSVAVDVSGYLNVGAVFTDVLNSGASYTVAAGGVLTVTNVPGMGGALLVLSGALETPPDAVSDLAVTAEASQELTLGWGATTGANSYDIYRSLLSGGGYEFITNTTALTCTDTGLTNATNYYYVIVSKDDATLLESGNFNEAVGMPHDIIGWANLQWPHEITHTVGITPTENIYGQVWIDGVTLVAGETEGLMAQVGLGSTTSAPSAWTDWEDATFHGDSGSNDEFKGQLTPEEVGEYYYVYRYSTTGGRDWVYADESGIISATGVISPGLLHVQASSDVIPTAAPQNLAVTHWGADHITTQWDAVSDGDLYAYDLYRYGEGETAGDAVKIARALAPTTSYTDTGVLTDQTYTYTVQALDTSFNKSAFSNEASGAAEARTVELHFRVTVPGFTPSKDTVYITGDNADVLGGFWSPNAQPITRLGANEWGYDTTASEGTTLEYKYTRGSWDVVENWGTLTGFANRQLTVIYGATGVMTVTNTVHNWRDPLVVATYPEQSMLVWNVTRPISATFNRELQTTLVNSSTFALTGFFDGTVYSGTFAFGQQVTPFTDPIFGSGNVTGTVVLFTPTTPLTTTNGYRVVLTKEGYVDEGPMQSDYVWDFGIRQLYLPLVFKSY